MRFGRSQTTGSNHSPTPGGYFFFLLAVLTDVLLTAFVVGEPAGVSDPTTTRTGSAPTATAITMVVVARLTRFG